MQDGFKSRGPSVWSLHIPPVSGYSDILLQSKDMHGVGITGNSKLPIGVNVRVNACLPLCVSPGGMSSVYLSLTL